MGKSTIFMAIFNVASCKPLPEVTVNGGFDWKIPIRARSIVEHTLAANASIVSIGSGCSVTPKAAVRRMAWDWPLGMGQGMGHSGWISHKQPVISCYFKHFL